MKFKGSIVQLNSVYWSLQLSSEKSIKKPKLSKLVGTFFRNALRSNLDLTSLADTKAGILISINGFILTVSVTASGFAVHNTIMTYAFISIIITSLGSIILAVLAVKPRMKKKLVKQEYLEDYNSLLYYQDMADLSPKEYSSQMNSVLYNLNDSKEEMISHLHILGSEIKKKYFWLSQAYTFFSIGLIISASLIIYALMYVEKTPFYRLSNGNVVYNKNEFYNIFEPSGATTMPDKKVLIVEDESSAHSLKLIEVKDDGKVIEIGSLFLPKKIKKIFKKDIEDLEAITSDENTVYGITSHSFAKNTKRKKERERFIMFNYQDGTIADFHMYSSLKKDLYKKFPNIFRQNILGSSGINIEGLSYESKSDTLLIGFRFPTIESKAIVIAITNPKEVFLKNEKPHFSQPIHLELNGLGIRDLTYDAQKNGFWIIAGSSRNRNAEFQLWWWDKENAKTSLVQNHPNIGFGEGITIINKDSNNPGLLIVEDNGKKPNKSAQFIIIDRDSL